MKAQRYEKKGLFLVRKPDASHSRQARAPGHRAVRKTVVKQIMRLSAEVLINSLQFELVLTNLAVRITIYTMKNFIVPIDFSPASLHGLDLAVLFSHRQPVHIQMVNVITTGGDYHPSTLREEEKYAEAKMEEIFAEYKKKLGPQSTLKYIIKRGKVYKEVVNQVNSYKEAAVAASTHGASGFEELFAGSNALKIVSSTAKPVFTLRSRTAPKEIKRIVVPIKLHVDTRQKVPVAAEIAELFGAEIHLVSISTRSNKRDIARLNSYMKQAASYLKVRKIPHVTKQVLGDSLPVLTLNYAEAVSADLVVIMASSIDKWNVFLGSYAQQMISRSNVPLLCIKPKEKHIPSGFSTQGA